MKNRIVGLLMLISGKSQEQLSHDVGLHYLLTRSRIRAYYWGLFC